MAGSTWEESQRSSKRGKPGVSQNLPPSSMTLHDSLENSHSLGVCRVPIFCRVPSAEYYDCSTKSEFRAEYLMFFNPFDTGDAYMRQLFHCLQWYAGSERVKLKNQN